MLAHACCCACCHQAFVHSFSHFPLYTILIPFIHASIHLSDTCLLLGRVHAAIYHPSLCCTCVVFWSQSPRCACYALLTDRQTDRHALVILISVLHLKLHVRFLICAAAQTCDPHMKPQFTSPSPGLLCPSNAERHNLSVLFCSGQGSTRPQAICFGHSSTARPRHGVPCGGNLTSRSLFKPQAAVLP